MTESGTVYPDIGDPPEEIVDAIRALTMEADANDREIPTLVVLEWLMSGGDAKTNERLLRWAWDRYVEQPKRDALKFPMPVSGGQPPVREESA